MVHPVLTIITPALADANNGNWRTARRWAHLLRAAYRVRLAAQWSAGNEDIMVALHARRSAPAIHAWKTEHPDRPLVVVLTGTDLYHDIAVDAAAQRSLELADRLVVLNSRAPAALPAHLRHKARVILQSCSARQPLHKSDRVLRALMVGHLRPEKDPGTYLEAGRLLAGRPTLRLDHIGAALDPVLGEAAASLSSQSVTYRWLGSLAHEATRRRIQRAHVLVHASRLEGGAHVIMEALRSGTPVLASRIDGNVGLLGEDYPGYFTTGDAGELAHRLAQLHAHPQALAHLRREALSRADRFSAEHEGTALLELLSSLG